MGFATLESTLCFQHNSSKLKSDSWKWWQFGWKADWPDCEVEIGPKSRLEKMLNHLSKTIGKLSSCPIMTLLKIWPFYNPDFWLNQTIFEYIRIIFDKFLIKIKHFQWKCWNLVINSSNLITNRSIKSICDQTNQFFEILFFVHFWVWSTILDWIWHLRNPF